MREFFGTKVSCWNVEELTLLDKLKGGTPQERAVNEIKARMEKKLREGLSSFVGLPNTKQNQLTIDYAAKNILLAAQREIDELGLPQQITLTLKY